MGHSEHGSQGFYSLFRLYAIKVLQDHFLPILHHLLHCPSDLPMEYFEVHSFTVSTMEVIAFLIFLILRWFSQYFPYVLNETFSLLGSLYLCTIVSFKGGLSPVPLKMSSFLFSHQKSKNLVSSAS